MGVNAEFLFGASALVLASDAPEIMRQAADQGRASGLGPLIQICDGVADEVQIQAALTALPSTGGKVLLSAGTFTLAAAVSRAIDNVTIQGYGKSTVLNLDAATAVIDAGSQAGWLFSNFSTDAGWLDYSSATNTTVDNCWNDRTLVQLVVSSQTTGDILYASSATQLSRLAIGATDTILSVQGGVPTWRTPANILTDLSGQAGAAFNWNSQSLTGINAITATTLNAIALGGNLTIAGYALDAGSGSAQINTTISGGGLTIQATVDGGDGATLNLIQISASPAGSDRIGKIYFRGRNTTPATVIYSSIFGVITTTTASAEESLLRFTNKLAGADNTVAEISGAGLVWADVGFNADEYYQVAGTQVVGARVVDARCDDTINSGDATTDGVIDALRDAMITHGLIAAA